MNNISKKTLLKIKHFFYKRAKLKRFSKNLIRRFPKIERKLKLIFQENLLENHEQFIESKNLTKPLITFRFPLNEDKNLLTEEAQNIFLQLKCNVGKGQL